MVSPDPTGRQPMSDEIPLEGAESSPALKPILFNILAMFFLVLSCLCPGYSLVIFAAPGSPFNPLPPGSFGQWTMTPTTTQTPLIYFPPTWTATATLEPTVYLTPTQGPPMTPTITLYYDPNNPNPNNTVYPFSAESGNPVYSASPKGCAWMGIAGTVYDSNHAPMNNLLIHLQGGLSGGTFDVDQVTGSVSDELDGEFEFTLAEEPVLSYNSLSIQLLDANRIPLSDKIFFNTYPGCDKNLITLNLIQATA
jgi:hypothetical protein